jgi:PaaX-like protein C-terminal domain
VEHHQGRLGRRLGGHGGEVVDEITPNQGGWVTAGHRDRRGQSLLPAGLTGPDQAAQPGGVGVVAHVERVEVDPGAPDDPGQPIRQRHRAVRLAAQHQRRRVGAAQGVAGVVVAVAVGQQGQPGAGPDLEQRQRLRQGRQRGQQWGAPLIRHDPRLPVALLPADWPGTEAQALFRALRRQLAVPADKLAGELLDTCPAPAD